MKRDREVIPRELWGCKGKQRLASKATAEHVASQLNHKARSKSRPQGKRQSRRAHAYRCSVCGWWHVGREPRARSVA